MLLSWRLGMNIAANSELRIRQARVTRNEIRVSLMDGREVSVPLAWSWRLSQATSAQRSNFRLIGTGQGIHWPDIDEDLSVEGMLYGSPARQAVTEVAGRGNSRPAKRTRAGR
jgi:hypothetical protein